MVLKKQEWARVSGLFLLFGFFTISYFLFVAYFIDYAGRYPEIGRYSGWDGNTGICDYCDSRCRNLTSRPIQNSGICDF